MFRRAAASLVSTAASSSTTTTTLRRPSEVLLGSVSTHDGVAARSASTLCVHLSTIPCFFSYAFGVIVFIACDDDDDDDDVSLIKRSIIHSFIRSSCETERLTDCTFVSFLDDDTGLRFSTVPCGAYIVYSLIFPCSLHPQGWMVPRERTMD